MPCSLQAHLWCSHLSVSFQAHPPSQRHELLLRLGARVPFAGAVTSMTVLHFEAERG